MHSVGFFFCRRKIVEKKKKNYTCQPLCPCVLLEAEIARRRSLPLLGAIFVLNRNVGLSRHSRKTDSCCQKLRQKRFYWKQIEKVQFLIQIIIIKILHYRGQRYSCSSNYAFGSKTTTLLRWRRNSRPEPVVIHFYPYSIPILTITHCYLIFQSLVPWATIFWTQLLFPFIHSTILRRQKKNPTECIRRNRKRKRNVNCLLAPRAIEP
jgi:hypothetical protein